MAKLTPRPTGRVLKALKRAGWESRKPPGKKHYVLVHPTAKAILTVPRHREIKSGTLRSILKAAELTVSEFEKLYK